LFIVIKQGEAFAGPYSTLTAANSAGAVTLNYGMFINTIISFLIVAFAMFIVIKNINRLKKKAEAAPAAPSTKECPYCYSAVPLKAIKCPNCTSDLKAV